MPCVLLKLNVVAALPSDLIGEISQYCFPRDVASLCLVSRSSCLVAEPVLYHTVALTGDSEALWRLRACLQTLIRAPVKAGWVRTLAMDFSSLSNEEKYWMKDSLGTLEDAVCRALPNLNSMECLILKGIRMGGIERVLV